MNGDRHPWRPTASIGTLRRRAQALQAVRGFFAARGVMEVETPLLVRHAVTDPGLANLPSALRVRPGLPCFLHTSPEYHMKRLLAAGAPDIYQLGKVFRDEELGRRHRPEFTLVEWYRLGQSFDECIGETCRLVSEVGQLLGRDIPPPERLGYRELFLRHAGVDPLEAGLGDIRQRAQALVPGGVSASLAASLGEHRRAWLDLLLVQVVEPALCTEGLVVVDRYPATQASLARLHADDPRVAERFEVYLDGMELANGYHELSDAREQRRRFADDRIERRRLGLPDVEPDELLLAALEAGLPDCCGVALGFDRLLMACLGLADIAAVVAFSAPEDDGWAAGAQRTREM